MTESKNKKNIIIKCMTKYKHDTDNGIRVTVLLNAKQPAHKLITAGMHILHQNIQQTVTYYR